MFPTDSPILGFILLAKIRILSLRMQYPVDSFLMSGTVSALVTTNGIRVILQVHHIKRFQSLIFLNLSWSTSIYSKCSLIRVVCAFTDHLGHLAEFLLPTTSDEFVRVCRVRLFLVDLAGDRCDVSVPRAIRFPSTLLNSNVGCALSHALHATMTTFRRLGPSSSCTALGQNLAQKRRPDPSEASWTAVSPPSNFFQCKGVSPRIAGLDLRPDF